MPEKSVLGLNEKNASMLAYAGIFVSGLLILIFERENKNVRFHAMQSVIFFLFILVGASIINWMFGWIFLVGRLVNFVVSSVCIATWLFLIYKAFRGHIYKIPIIGDVAWNQVHK